MIDLINVNKYTRGGYWYYSIDILVKEDGNILPSSYTTELRSYSWNKSEIVNAIIRCKYSQDRVEAIINNHFLFIADWIDKLIAGDTNPMHDKEYDDLQAFRLASKRVADEILNMYPADTVN